jgi:hypothetical protein
MAEKLSLKGPLGGIPPERWSIEIPQDPSDWMDRVSCGEQPPRSESSHGPHQPSDDGED